MKKVIILVLVVVISASCTLFEKSSMTEDEISEMQNENDSLENALGNATKEIDRLKYELEGCEAQAAAFAEQSAGETTPALMKYCVITGSFRDISNAEKHAEEIKQKGGEGTVIEGNNGYWFVVYSSHNEMNEASTKMQKARLNGFNDAWIYDMK